MVIDKGLMQDDCRNPASSASLHLCLEVGEEESECFAYCQNRKSICRNIGGSRDFAIWSKQMRKYNVRTLTERENEKK
jgi:hypothetical protein